MTTTLLCEQVGWTQAKNFSFVLFSSVWGCALTYVPDSQVFTSSHTHSLGKSCFPCLCPATCYELGWYRFLLATFAIISILMQLNICFGLYSYGLKYSSNVICFTGSLRGTSGFPVNGIFFSSSPFLNQWNYPLFDIVTWYQLFEKILHKVFM